MRGMLLWLARILVSLVGVLMVTVPVTTSANNDVSGEIIGYVYDSTNHRLQEALVTLRYEDAPSSVRLTNRNGYFVFLPVLPGNFIIVVSKPGYLTCLGFAAVHPNQTTEFHFRLPGLTKSLMHCGTFARSPNIDF